MNQQRKGFALVMTLWALTILAVTGIAVALAGREAFDVSRNRHSAERAFWLAEGCVNSARAAIDDALAAGTSQPARTRLWRRLDLAIDAAPFRSMNCELTLEAAGNRLDVNGATEEQLRRMLTLVAGPEHVTELVDALMDWRDTDQVARPFGAEREWYDAAHRRAPRDNALASVDELRSVRGFEMLGGLDSLFSEESSRISINTAPAAVLAAAPGLTANAIARIVEYRNDGHQIDDLLAITGLVSQSDVDSLMTRYADLAHVTTLEPDAWIVTATATDGVPSIRVTSEIRIVRKADRAVVARHRIRE